MTSVKRKLFIQIGLLVITLVGIMILANTMLYKPYYQNALKNQLASYYNQLNEVVDENYEIQLETIMKIEASSNVDILIIDDGETVYSSSSFMIEERLKKRLNLLEEMVDEKFDPRMIREGSEQRVGDPNKPPIHIEKTSDYSEAVSFYIVKGDALFDSQLLILAGDLKSGEHIELRIPILSIQNNINISNRFMVYCGIVLFIVAMFYAHQVSKKFTKPILEMNQMTKEMSDLKFDKTCNINSKDELGELASSINELSESLSQSISELDQKNLQLETLINNVSHELKTPLALIHGYAEAIALNISKDKEKTAFYTNVIIDESKKMNRLVDTLLTIRTYENKEGEMYSKVFDIALLIDEILLKFNPLLSKKELSIAFSNRREEKVVGDAFDIEQILTNFISNAINYVDDKRIIEIQIERGANLTRVLVYNSCSTFNDDELDKMWNKFTKRDLARTRENGGHGLGLSIVKAIQESKGLECGVRNTKDGVVFWFDVENYKAPIIFYR